MGQNWIECNLGNIKMISRRLDGSFIGRDEEGRLFKSSSTYSEKEAKEIRELFPDLIETKSVIVVRKEDTGVVEKIVPTSSRRLWELVGSP